MNFDKYLFNFSIGPVQPFIAAARRTRDLWFGSQLLSELSFIAAKTISETGGELIFPHPNVLEFADKSEINVANIILAEIPKEGKTPQQMVEKTENAVKEKWKECAKKVFEKYQEIIDQEIWDSQINDALEFFAAWVPIHNNDYKAARDRLNEIFAARKNSRDFNQPSLNANERYLEKSPLDGRNETILDTNSGKSFDPEKLPEEIQRQLRLKKNEFLDAIGMIKRGSEIKQFPSVDRVAIDPWIRHIAKNSNSTKKLEEIKKICEKLPQVIKVKSQAYKTFPFEGSILYLNRHKSIKEELSFKKDSIEEKKLEEIAKILEKLYKVTCRPSSYFAMIKADGDKMGNTISKITTKEGLKNFSSALSDFALVAPQIVTEKGGACIYAGGDDVFAFLPLDTCLSCARKLREEFKKKMSKIKKDSTLSVGISIGHFLEPMDSLIHFANQAEKMAKEGEKKEDERNGLAITVQTRGNAPIGVREQWKDEKDAESLDNRIMSWRNAFKNNSLPFNFPYSLHILEEYYLNWSNETLVNKALPADLLRLFKRSTKSNTQKGENTMSNNDKEKITKILENTYSVDCLKKLTNEILIARHIERTLSFPTPRDGGDQ